MASSKVLGPVPCVRLDGPPLEVTVLPASSDDRTPNEIWLEIDATLIKWARAALRNWPNITADLYPARTDSSGDDDVQPDVVVG